MFSKLRRRIIERGSSVRPELDSFIDFLVAGRNLRREGAVLTFYHPRVEDGLRLVLDSHRSLAEHMLALVCDALIAWDADGGDWGAETALGVRRAMSRLQGIDPTFAPQTRAGLDAYLLRTTAGADRHGDFERAFRDLADYGSRESIPGRLARLLLIGGPKSTGPHMVVADFWKDPSPGDDELTCLRAHSSAEALVNRFVSDVLPYIHIYYPDTVVRLLRNLVPTLDEAFWRALDAVASLDVNQNIGAIVTGVCTGATHDFDAVIERFAAAAAEADKWMENFAKDQRSAVEHEVDAAYADHLIEEPGERYYNSTEGMKAVVDLRCAREGVEWLPVHPHRELAASALADLFNSSEENVEPAQLRMLVGCAIGWARVRAWSAAQKHWDTSLDDLLDAELQRTDIENSSLRGSLIKIVVGAGHDQDAWVDRLLCIGRRSSAVRRLELVLDVAMTNLDDDPKVAKGQAPARVDRGYRLAAAYEAYEQELARAMVDSVAEHNLRDTGNRLSPEARELLIRLLPAMPSSVAGAFACIAAAVQIDVISAVKRLLGTGDRDDGIAAIQAMSIKNGEAAAAVMTEALKHGRYAVRRSAFKYLVTAVNASDRSVLLGMAGDPSADVRLAFTLAMKEHKWPEAIDALIELLKDTRNFSSDQAYLAGPSWAHFRVARTAAAALASYDALPERAISALLAAVADANCKDSFVACEALKAVAIQDDARVTEALVASLRVPGIGGSMRYRPLSQAGAWGLFDRALAEKLELGKMHTQELIDAALTMYGSIAAPVLCVTGILGGDARRMLLRELDVSGLQARRELLLVASAVAGNAAGEIEDPLLTKLAERGENLPPEGSSDAVEDDLSRWSMGFDSSKDVAGTTAWIASAYYKLPVAQPDFDPREYELPKRIGVLTMRSLSPDREEYEGEDDGTAG